MYVFTTLLVVPWCDCLFTTAVNCTGAGATPSATSTTALSLCRAVIPLAALHMAVT